MTNAKSDSQKAAAGTARDSSTGAGPAAGDMPERSEQERQMASLLEVERAARIEAERANRNKDAFLATLGHELRTPLNAIVGWAALLCGGQLSPEQQRDAAQRIGRNAQMQAQLISDLLDVSAILSGKLRLNNERVPLARPLQGAIDAVTPAATNKQVLLEGPLLDPTLEVDCDPGRLQQVFWNLLVNAVKFTPPGGCVTVAVRARATSVLVSIADTGVGIEPGFVPRLFEHFAQADSPFTGSHGGLGLGLPISEQLMTLHAGDIRVHSAGVGLGSTFTVMLPRQGCSDSAPLSSWGDAAPELLASDDAAQSPPSAAFSWSTTTAKGAHFSSVCSVSAVRS